MKRSRKAKGVYYLDDKPRDLPWLAVINRKGFKKRKMFKTESEAILWKSEIERNIRLTGLPQTKDDLKDITVGYILTRYLREATPTKKSRVNESSVLNKFLREQKELCSRSVAYVTKTDAYDYRNKRLKALWKGKPITTRTIAREIVILRRAFNVAKEEWGYSSITNPFAAMKLTGTKYQRERPLEPGEIEKLDEASKRCLGLNKIYVPLAIHLAVDTGMRLQEIFGLRWKDINFEHRTIRITKSKTDDQTGREGRTIALPFWPMFHLTHLAAAAGGLRPKDLPDRIFPMTKGAFSQSWADLVKRADLDNLQFRDLRHEASTRFDRAGLTLSENNLMRGEKTKGMYGVYVHADLTSIRDKLDRFVLTGKTYSEWQTELASQSQEERDKRLLTVIAGMDPDYQKGVISMLTQERVERLLAI